MLLLQLLLLLLLLLLLPGVEYPSGSQCGGLPLLLFTAKYPSFDLVNFIMQKALPVHGAIGEVLHPLVDDPFGCVPLGVF